MPESQPVKLASVSVTVAAPIAAVWAVLTDFAHPQRLAATITGCTVTGEGVGAVRIVESSGGRRIHERLLECDVAARRFRYEALDSGDMPFPGIASYECTVVLTDPNSGETGLIWRSFGRIWGPLDPIRAYLEALYSRATANIAAIAVAGG